MSYQAPTETQTEAAFGLPVHDARALTGAEGTALILLDGKAYTLRITRAGKLILTK
ncbi:hemin uptake protein HemP [Rhodobacterales bacterium HKCCE3408]|nr:hemin uptake protein HemP [Rhodobacterales bacterium HKCCE3408]